MKRPLATAVAIASGLVVLLGYFIPIPIFETVRQEIVRWAIILAAVAMLVGAANLLTTHLDKIAHRQKGFLYSLLLVLSLVVTALLGFIFGPQHPNVQLIVKSVVIPVEISLLAALTVTLVYASIRLLRRRADVMTVIFLITALLALLGTAPLPFGEVGILNYVIRPWIAQVPATAGVRGLLIGISLGTLLTGLRILLGADRPYGGK